MRVLASLLLAVFAAACGQTPSSNHPFGPGPDTRPGDTQDAGTDGVRAPLEFTLAVGVEVPGALFGAETRVTGIVEGHLPHGLLLTHAGTLRGRPSVEQDAVTTLALETLDGVTTEETVTFRVRSGAPAILLAHPPAAAIGWDYAHAFELADLDGPATWTIRRGALPPGITLDAAAGTLSGSPTKTGVYAFVIRGGSETVGAERAYAIRVGDPVLQGYAETFRFDGIEDLSPSGMILSRDPAGVYQDYGDSGMWNGTYAAGIAWRYAWLRTDAAAADLQYMVDDLTRFREITGVPGLTCRGYEHDEWMEAGLPGPQQHPDVTDEGHLSDAPGYEGWTWKGDTSRDQVTGLVLGNALIHDVAPGPPIAEAAAENLVEMALHVWDNGMQLVDPDGEATHYGDCSAYCIEGFCPMPIPNGFGACLTGSWLVAAAHAAAGAEQERLAAFVTRILGEEAPPADAENPGEYDYLGTMDASFYSFMNYETRWYNVNLASDSFYTFARLLPDGPVRDRLIGYWTDILWTDKGTENTKRRVQSLANPWWSFLYLAGTQRYDADAVYDGLVQLINFMPPPRLGVDIHNSDLYPVDPDSPADAPWTVEPLPADQQCSGTNFVWQRNPFALDCGGRADTQWAGTDFLAPYWLGVVYGYVSDNL